VVICHNHLSTQMEIEQALTHELIHAYDHCRAKNMDWMDCRQHACSEIRAASLSGAAGVPLLRRAAEGRC
jgi:inner membrane protease ATP23